MYWIIINFAVNAFKLHPINLQFVDCYSDLCSVYSPIVNELKCCVDKIGFRRLFNG